MIKAIRKRARPDNLKNQIRAGGQSFARKLYLYCVIGLFVLLAWTFTGHWFFLDAEGLAIKDRVVIAPDYQARVMVIAVKPGDRVHPGQPIATLQSREIIEQIADVTSRRATILSREAQIAGRSETIRQLLPAAQVRRARAEETLARLHALAARQLTTAPRLQEAQREVFEAQREQSSMTTELEALRQELTNIQSGRRDLDEALKQMAATYNNGQVVAQVEGIVGPRVPSPGQIMKAGEPMLDVYRGTLYVWAFLPTGRLYSVAPGDKVRVTDGQSTAIGYVARIENLTDALPPEFQVTFRAVDRQQVARIEFPAAPPFPIQAKVKVSTAWSPQGLAAFAKGLATGAGETVSGWLRGLATAISGPPPQTTG